MCWNITGSPPPAGLKKLVPKKLVRQQHRHRPGEHRHDAISRYGDQPGPAEERQLQQRETGRAHVQDRHDDVDRAMIDEAPIR